MNKLEKTCINTLNYMFLRAVTKKDTYPEHILGEIAMYLTELASLLEDKNPILIDGIKKIISSELEEGNYVDTLDVFSQQLSDFYEEDNIDVDLETFDIIHDFYLEIAVSLTKEDRLTTMIKEIGFEKYICHSFEEAKANDRRKNIVIDGNNIYLTYKDEDFNLGEFICWVEDEFEEDSSVYGSVLGWVEDLYSRNEESIDRDLSLGTFPFFFTPYDEIEEERE